MKPLEDYLRPTQKELFSKLCAMYRDRAVICKNKYIIVRGEAPVMLLAHLDTVHKEPVKHICKNGNGNILMSPQGIGGDDRCGVHSLLGELADRGLLVIADLLYRKHGILWFFVYSCLQTAKL